MRGAKINSIKNILVTKKVNKIISCILIIAMLYPQFDINPKKNEKIVSENNTSVQIVSFMRGEVSDLRSSELLEAKVMGYEGNLKELNYTWTNNLGTYLYVYNSHNMYNIMNTDGEIEIQTKEWNKNKASGGGKNFAWAAVYGANLYSNNRFNSLSGGISVKVTDDNGNLIGEASYNNDFLKPNIQKDLENSVFGIFEGEKENVKDLLGESAIVHVDCVASTVNSGNLITGNNIATLYKENNDYYIEGLSKGVASLEIELSKDNCKFHQESSGEVETTIYVFKKPYVKTTTTTLMIADLDKDCTYYVDGVKGIEKNGVIIFDGLTPNTDYQVEVVAEYKNLANETKKVYTYLYEKTKPVYLGVVNTYLDNIQTDISEILDNKSCLYLKEEKDATDNYIAMEKVNDKVGTYNAILENGIYNIYVKNGEEYKLFHYQQLIISNANRERAMYFYSVNYNGNGGKFTDDTEKYSTKHHENTSVTVEDIIPTRNGYRFDGWVYDDNTYVKGQEIISSIDKTINLKAKWIPIQDKVNVKFIIKHESDDGEIDKNCNQKLIMHLTQKEKGGTTYYSSNLANTDFSYTPEQWKGISTTVDNTTTVESQTIFKDLPYNYDYSVNAGMAGYKMTKIDVSTQVDNEENETYNVVVYLTYAPDYFTMNFNVKMADTVDKSLWPESVDVKVIKWYNISSLVPSFASVNWYPIEEHITRTRAVRFDETGNKKEVYQVKVYEDKDANKPFYYSVQVVGLHTKDNEDIILDNINDDGATYISKDNTYRAVVNVSNGVIPSEATSNEGIYGVYDSEHNNYLQQGSILATIDVETYKIKLDANGGTFTDSTQVKSLENLIKMPNISSSEYIPSRNDNYVFKGWYYKNKANEEVNVPAEGTKLNTVDTDESTLVLYARWAEPLTISGTVSAAGTYMLDGKEVAIHLPDLPSGVKVLLQEVGADGAGYTVREVDKKFRVTGNSKVGKITYSFNNIPNDGKKYQISILATNYDDTYQNSKTGGEVSEYSRYNKNDNKAIFEENGVETIKTFVNIYLSFEPEEFNVEYEIDASEIKEQFRPKNINTKILYDDLQSGNNPTNWPVISQHDAEGIVSNFDKSGIIKEAYPVWILACQDKRLYDYSIRIDSYELGGKEVSYSNDAPFYLGYSKISRYDYVTKKGTNVIKAKMAPKNYNVILDVNSSEVVSNMDNHKLTDEEYGISYKWGDEIDINANPVRDKFVFVGWYDEAGNKVRKYPAGTYGNITLKAKWMVDNNENGIPDEYQKPVKFRVINGSWANNTTEDYIVYVDLKDKDGRFSSSGSGILTLPINMVPNKGYDLTGKWTDNALNGQTTITVTGTDMSHYYYSFLKKNTVAYQSEADVIVDEPHTHVVEVIENEKIRINPNGGLWIHEGVTYIETVDFIMGTEGMLLRNAYKEGYVFGGWKCLEGPHDERVKYTFVADWLIDTNNDKVPDIYQKVITFKVENGSWENNSNEDIVKWVTLEDSAGMLSINGSGTVEIPTNMVPAYGYEGGKWKEEEPLSVITNRSKGVYIYEFAPIGNKKITYSKYNESDTMPKKNVDSIPYGKKIKVNPNTGFWFYNGIEYTEETIFTIEKDMTMADASLPYYVFTGWEVTEGIGDIEYVYTAKYIMDQSGNNPFLIDLEDLYEYSDVRIEYYFDEILDENATIIKNNQVVGSKITDFEDKIKEDYVLEKTENLPLTVSKIRDSNTIKIYYSKDANKDRIPDKYQIKVVYRILNGCWIDNTNNDRVYILDTKKKVDSKWVDNPAKLGETIPSDMKPYEGYADEGNWCSELSPETVITTDTIYTYSFIENNNDTKEGDNNDENSKTEEGQVNNNKDDIVSDNVPKDNITERILDKDLENDTDDDRYEGETYTNKSTKSRSIVTGDSNNINVWLVIMHISLLLIIVINGFVFKKRRRNNH